MIEYRNRESRNASKLIVLIAYPDIPHLGLSSKMQRPCRTRHDSASDSAYVVGIDLETDRVPLADVEGQRCTDAAERFGKTYRGTAVQDAHGLMVCRCYGHGAADEVIAKLDNLDAERSDQRVPMTRPERLETGLGKPD